MKYLILIISLGLVVACQPMGTRLAELRSKQPSGDDFSHVLAREYLGYAESLAEESHPVRADRFADKGLKALAGEDVMPSEAESYAPSRQELLAVLTPDVKEVAPEKAARAQVLFDCWADGEELCKDTFSLALSDVQSIADILVHDGENRYAIPFDSGGVQLNSEAQILLNAVARRVSSYGKYQIQLMPYERSRMNAAKKTQSSNRILAVERALIAKGVDAGAIHVYRGRAASEVFLSVDEAGGAQDQIALTIQTYGQPKDISSP